MAESSSKSSGSSGSGASATQDKKDDKRYGIERDSEGNVQPLEYPEPEVKDSITYVDPRPKDWPQKADRSVMVGVVHQVDPEDNPKGAYVDNAGLLDQDELEVGGTAVTDAQVIAGGGQLTLILNGQAFVLGGLGGGIQSDLQKALQLNANS